MVVFELKLPGGLLHPKILNDGHNLICLQSNCVARKRHARSFHDKLYKELRFGDPYEIRRPKQSDTRKRNLAREVDRPDLGSFLMMQDEKAPESKCGVAFLFAQYNMGDGSCLYFPDKEYVEACKRKERKVREDRLEAFKECLRSISLSSHTLCRFDKILFPFKIGCFKAGGHWPDYLTAIDNFSSEIPSNIKVYIVKKDK
nr:MAG: wsv206-like protein [Chiromantes dehaani nimavirus]